MVDAENQLSGTEDSWGKGVTLVRGWEFPPTAYREAAEAGRVLIASIEMSNTCDLLCTYCSRSEPATMVKKRLEGELTLRQSIEMIDQLHELGAKSYYIVGAGEPVLDPCLPFVIKYIHSLGSTPLVTSNGRKINENTIAAFEASGASVIVKLESFNPAIQDYLVDCKGYTAQRNRGLELLLEAGFNKTDGNGTRLGVTGVVCAENYDEIPGLVRFAREHNIMPIYKTFMPCGRTRDRTDLEVTREEFINLSRRVQAIDKQRYGIEYERLWPYLGGVPCSQMGPRGITVTTLGDIYGCPAQQRHFGNIKTTSLKDAFERLCKESENRCFGCPPRDAYINSPMSGPGSLLPILSE